jgi:hypothetical protein
MRLAETVAAITYSSCSSLHLFSMHPSHPPPKKLNKQKQLPYDLSLTRHPCHTVTIVPTTQKAPALATQDLRPPVPSQPASRAPSAAQAPPPAAHGGAVPAKRQPCHPRDPRRSPAPPGKPRLRPQKRQPAQELPSPRERRTTSMGRSALPCSPVVHDARI